MSTNGCTVQNAGTNLYADINGNNVNPGANVIIYSLNQTGGTRNQNWRFVRVNGGKNLYIIESVLTGGYAGVDSAQAGQAIKTSQVSTVWEVSIVDTFSPNFTIKLPNTSLVWSVPSGSGVRTDITLAAAASNNTTQQWKFTSL